MIQQFAGESASTFNGVAGGTCDWSFGATWEAQKSNKEGRGFSGHDLEYLSKNNVILEVQNSVNHQFVHVMVHSQCYQFTSVLPYLVGIRFGPGEFSVALF